MNELNELQDIEAQIAALLAQKANLKAKIDSGAMAVGDDNQVAGARGVAAQDVGGSIATGEKSIAAGGHVVYAEKGAIVTIGEQPVTMTAIDRQSALGKYLAHLISQNRYLQLQGIRSGGKLVNIELNDIYITLRATRERQISEEERWLKMEAELAPGERQRGFHPGLRQTGTLTETIVVSVNEALAANKRLVVLGDPGSGKTTLLRYLTLLFARDIAEENKLVQQQLGLPESGYLPVLLPLRQIGAHLTAHHAKDDGTDGHGLLLDFLRKSLKNERLEVPVDFFDGYLHSGQAVLMLDGMDEVSDRNLRQRVARLIEAFIRAYPTCRYVISSRVKGYEGAARLGEGCVTTTVRDFTLDDVHNFLSQWHRLVAIGQMGAGATAEQTAKQQSSQLLHAIKANPRVRELAINPLMLTVIAIIHRDQVKLPDRRAELYHEAVDVLLGKWDEAKGLGEQGLNLSEKRLVLQAVAWHMHENRLKEIEREPLCALLQQQMGAGGVENSQHNSTTPSAEWLLGVLEERTGLLVERGQGIYAFSHLTFQEYLAALAIAGDKDYIELTLTRAAEEWWREVILLQAGHLSTQNRPRTEALIRAIADAKTEPSPYYNLVLAAACLSDISSRVMFGALEDDIRARLQREFETPPVRGRWANVRTWLTHGMSVEALSERRKAAAAALGQMGGHRFWQPPYGEPLWVHIPAGEFWLGSDPQYDRYAQDHEQPQQRVYLPEYWIAKTPITQAQYALFVRHTGHDAPDDWDGDNPPRGKDQHPVVKVSWHDAIAYCNWLSQMTGKHITLPSEAEWEKAARGDQDRRIYPWGDVFDMRKCNCGAFGLQDTSAVGIFPKGASPYGCLDMAGNVWEWTRSRFASYPYQTDDGREDLKVDRSDEEDDNRRVLRGGSFSYNGGIVRCAYRNHFLPGYRRDHYGFRVSCVRLPSLHL